MMVLFFHAARLAMVAFDPFLSSRPIAEVLNRSPQGTLIVDHHYYWFSSVFFYTNRPALLLNARVDNLVYGSYAPGAPEVFIDDAKFRELWAQPDVKYLVVRDSALPRLQGLVGAENLHLVTVGGGKVLLANQLIAPEKLRP
ncbi:MAG TPA: glycosyltransferase family 39 protein, partial [Terriglobales bacterium]